MSTYLIVAIVAVLAFVFYVYSAQAKLKATPMQADSERIITLTDKNFNFQTKNKLVLVDFWASWCAPCRMMAPILNDLSNELDEKAYVGKVNIEAYQSLAQQFKVRNIPTMILFQNGQEVDRVVGVKTKEFLLNRINKVVHSSDAVNKSN